MSRKSTLIVIAGLGVATVWYLTKDNKPRYDSLGAPIDYTHSISWIKPTTDAGIIADARKSWQLEEKIRKDERSLLITNSLAKKLRAKYTFTKDSKLIAVIKGVVNDEFYTQTWVVPEKSKDLNGVVLTINKDRKINFYALVRLILIFLFFT